MMRAVGKAAKGDGDADMSREGTEEASASPPSEGTALGGKVDAKVGNQKC
jgi:hypothetical protein